MVKDEFIQLTMVDIRLGGYEAESSVWLRPEIKTLERKGSITTIRLNDNTCLDVRETPQKIFKILDARKTM